MIRNHIRYTERDLFVDGVILAAGLAFVVCVLAALGGF